MITSYTFSPLCRQRCGSGTALLFFICSRHYSIYTAKSLKAEPEGSTQLTPNLSCEQDPSLLPFNLPIPRTNLIPNLVKIR
jgi:hypothetical protein